MGVIGNAIPFSLINWGETRIDSGLTAILMSTVPLATIMLAPAFVRDEPVTPGKLLGVAFGMAGVAVLIGPGALMGAHGELLGEIAVTGASVVLRRERAVGAPAAAHAGRGDQRRQPAQRHARRPAPESRRRSARGRRRRRSCRSPRSPCWASSIPPAAISCCSGWWCGQAPVSPR